MGKCNPQYAERNIEEFYDLYLRHVMAMTTEKLHSKMNIAAELAWRDSEIERLKNNGLAEMLDELISKAFDNEEKFIENFICEKETVVYSMIELNSIHVASGETRVSIKCITGHIRDILISTADFIEWCDHAK